jgi:NADPH:quinone reductase-like Zn-dependent oxidoreductase
MQSNRRVVLPSFGGPESFTIVDEPIPEPGAGQVRVRVLAASVQYTDVIIRRGEYPDLKEKPPFTPGYDVVGAIDAIGPEVKGFAIGDRVADMTMIGSYSRCRLLEANRIVRVPADVDPAAAVSLVLGWTTAYQLLHRHARVQRGQSILVHGAAGAVGQALLELGRRVGLEMYGTCRAEHADLVASLGATPIDYKKEDFTKVLANGVDVVFDGIAEDGFRKSWQVVKRGGFLAAYGFSAGIQAGVSFFTIGRWFMRVPLWNLLPNGKRAGFYSITKLRKAHPDWFAEDLAQLFAWLADGSIDPRVQERIDLDDVADAHRRLERGGLTGKLVIVPS